MQRTKVNNLTPRANDTQYFFTKGQQYSLDGVEYVGEYHLRGEEAFTGPIPSQTARLLRRLYRWADHYRYEQLFGFDVPAAQFKDPIPFTFDPIEIAYKRGFDTRYFVEKREDHATYAIEIDLGQYNNIGEKGGIDGGLYLHTTVEWKLTGTIDSITNFNRRQLYKASRVVPSVAYAVRNLIEFARITDLPNANLDTGRVKVELDLPSKEEVKKAIQDHYNNQVDQ